MDFAISDRAQDLLQRSRTFVKEDIEAVETRYQHAAHERKHGGDWKQWGLIARMELGTHGTKSSQSPQGAR